MLFNSLAFFIFLAITLLVYYLVPKKAQWAILLGASLVFYVSFSWKSLFFILSTILTVWGAGKLLAKLDAKQSTYLQENPDIEREEKKKFKNSIRKKKKLVLVLTILFNFGILFFLKYANFFIFNFQSLFELCGWKQNRLVLNVILPLGISFYTFQSIGYLIDVYWGKVEAEQNVFRLGLFISFFPQIIEGPISRFSELDGQLKEKHNFDYKKVTQGMQLILWGLFKKMVIADALAPCVNYMFDNALFINGAQTIIGTLAYLLQDYADFSGCIDIARGSSECFGITLPQNFNHPYFSFTIPEYWRRWHITLGTWFKDYIFYPLSISKFSIKFGKFCKKFMKNFGKQMPAIFGLIVVWLTTGLWHGASWNYVLWGLYYGIIIILGIIFEPLTKKIKEKLKINDKSKFYKAFQWLRTMFLLAIGRIIFRANTISDSFTLIGSLFDFKNYSLTDTEFKELVVSLAPCIVAMISSIILFVVDLISEKHPEQSIRDMIDKKPTYKKYFIFLSLLLIVLIFGCYGPSFTAIDFEYMKF